MSDAACRELIERYWQAFIDKDLDSWCACYATDAVYEDVPTGFVGTPREFYGDFLTAIPDQEPELDRAVVTDGAFALSWTIRGSLDGSFGPITGTGQSFELKGASIGQIADGKIVHNRDYWDLAGLLAQFGTTELPAEV
jgi:steroid delta-isomerase-like uncharacterized protein